MQFLGVLHRAIFALIRIDLFGPLYSKVNLALLPQDK